MLKQSRSLASWLLILVIVGISSSPVLSQESGPEGCLDHLGLVSLSYEDLTSATPCDLPGLLFLEGWGMNAPLGFDPTSSPHFAYYTGFRRFLEKRYFSDGSIDAYATLIAALAYLPEPPPESDMGTTRESYYRGFAIAVYWDDNADALASEDDFLSAAIGIFVAGGIVQSFEELVCFVRSDIPTLSITQVYNSKIFKDCLEKGFFNGQ